MAASTRDDHGLTVQEESAGILYGYSVRRIGGVRICTGGVCIYRLGRVYR